MVASSLPTFLRTKLRELFGIDVRALAAFRIGVAVLVILDLLNRVPNLIAHYSDAGVLPRSLLLGSYTNQWHLSLHIVSGLWQVQAVLFSIAGIFAFMLLLGYRTRLATIMSWVLLISLQNRNPLILQSHDTLLRLCLFWGMFIPWHQKISLDAALRRVASSSTIVTSLATGALLIQVAVVYLSPGLYKSADVWLLQGNGISLALQTDQYATALGLWIQAQPFLITLLSRITYLLEIVAPLALFVPIATRSIRLLVVVALIGFHLGIHATMSIGLFPWVDIVTLLLFLPTIYWDQLTAWVKRWRMPPIFIYYDSDCGFCYRAVLVVRSLLVPFNATIAPAMDKPEILRAMAQENSWVIVDHRQQRHFGYNGWLAIVAVSPWARWTLPVFRPALCRTIGSAVYRWVARHRKVTCEVGTAHLSHSVAKEKRGYRWYLLQGAVAAAFLYVIAVNVGGHFNPPWVLPQSVRVAASVLRLDQKWSMFSPYPPVNDGWYVMPGLLRNGTKVDVFTGRQEVMWTKPKHVFLMYPSNHWRIYLMRLHLAANKRARGYYAQYLCRQWNLNHSYNEQLLNLEITYILESTSLIPGEAPAAPTPYLLWRQECAQPRQAHR